MKLKRRRMGVENASSDRGKELEHQVLGAQSAADGDRADHESEDRSPEGSERLSGVRKVLRNHVESPPDSLSPHVGHGRRSRRHRVALALTAMACISSGTAAVLTTIEHRTAQERSNVEDEILAFSHDAVARLLSTDTAEPDAYVDRVLVDATGTWHDEFAQRKKSVADTMRTATNTTVGRVLDAGIERAENGSTVVLVAATAETTPTTEGATAPERQVQQYQLRIGVTMVDSQPKLSSVGFIQ
ncbi:hypothetical protein EEB14_48470 [Rhodococcus sp. WS4]|nr:hypothetical protein EEB14_48470 [Rhodococcus sp. WS4]